MAKLLAVLMCVAACTSAPTSETTAETTCPPVHTSQPIYTGDVITAKLRDLTVDNGIVRIRYGAHALDIRDTGVTQENNEQHMAHVLAARHTDAPAVREQNCLGACHNGSHWHDAMLPWYGDGTQFVLNPLKDADRVRVLYAGDTAVELAYEWDSVRLDTLRAANTCQIGKFPDCGPTSKDVEGSVVYKRDGETLKSIKVVKIWKTVRIEQCANGYYAAVRSNPPLIWPEQGARAFRLGYVSSVAAWTCDGSRIVRHPNSGFHADLGVSKCIADLPEQLTGHASWPFIRFMETVVPTRFSSLQYTPGQLGSPGSLEVWDHVGPDGRPYPWQVFIGAIEYETSDVTNEPTQSTLDYAATAAEAVEVR